MVSNTIQCGFESHRAHFLGRSVSVERHPHQVGGQRRAAADLERVRELRAAGESLAAISRSTGISRASLRQWLTTPPSYLTNIGTRCPAIDARNTPDWPEERYAYLFGLYLGDGCISEQKKPGVFTLRISLDNAYPNIIAECEAAITAVLPGRRVSRVPAQGCTVVTAYSKHWPCLFPQHGPGKKHLRQMVLERWQTEIVAAHPGSFLRGLVHSDGCRYINRVVTRGKAYEYATYSFANLSYGIHQLFGWACDLLGVDARHPNARSTSVATRRGVEILDRYIGAKS